MTTKIALFNNKGGVGKTTFLYHISHRLAERGRSVLMVDCDSQCNLTSYTLNEKAIEKSWSEDGNSIYRAIEPVARTVGDIRDRAPRAQTAIHRSINKSFAKNENEFVFVDLGPNLGALNRSVLSGCDFIIVPVSPDLFSIRGTENLGQKLVKWRKEWDQCKGAWNGEGLEIPDASPTFLGYVTQQHNIRNNKAGMTQGWQIFGGRIETAVQENIVDRLADLGQVGPTTDGSYDLGKIPNLHSLIPYSQKAKLPVFQCTHREGLVGQHIYKARDSRNLFDPIANIIEGLAPAIA